MTTSNDKTITDIPAPSAGDSKQDGTPVSPGKRQAETIDNGTVDSNTEDATVASPSKRTKTGRTEDEDKGAVMHEGDGKKPATDKPDSPATSHDKTDNVAMDTTGSDEAKEEAAVSPSKSCPSDENSETKDYNGADEGKVPDEESIGDDGCTQKPSVDLGLDPVIDVEDATDKTLGTGEDPEEDASNDLKDDSEKDPKKDSKDQPTVKAGVQADVDDAKDPKLPSSPPAKGSASNDNSNVVITMVPSEQKSSSPKSVVEQVEMPHYELRTRDSKAEGGSEDTTAAKGDENADVSQEAASQEAVVVAQ